ncbi:MAG: DUF1292 domain-containing protein, partial [Lachnospiraceae bacterium]|nr:DUF1292 domain-containing protein [Lachnospiraceae bacterium]
GENGEEIEFEVIETTRLGGVDYYLVCDTEDKESAYILKDVSDVDEETSVYEFVEDDKEYDAIAAIFEEIVDDVDFE